MADHGGVLKTGLLQSAVRRCIVDDQDLVDGVRLTQEPFDRLADNVGVVEWGKDANRKAAGGADRCDLGIKGEPIKKAVNNAIGPPREMAIIVTGFGELSVQYSSGTTTGQARERLRLRTY